MPFSLEECTIPTGALCSSLELELCFEKLIRRRLGSLAESILTPKVAAAVSHQFEAINRNFNPYDQESDMDYYEVPLRGAPEMPHIGLEEGFLRLSK